MEQKELKKWLIDVILVIDDNKEEAKRMINYAIKELETTKPVNVDLADIIECECGGNERVALDCTMKPCKHPKYYKG